MKILVTGSAGFIGFHLTGRLLQEGHEVVGLDSITDYYEVQLKHDRLAEHGILAELPYNSLLQSVSFHNYRFIRLKLEERELLPTLFAEEKFDMVVHLAAQAGIRYSISNPQAYIDSNILGFANLLECCRHYPVKHLVFASSSSVYGLNGAVPFSTHHSTDHPISLYAASKKSNELMAHTYSHLFGIPVTGLRFFTVYGPWGRPDMALFLFTRAIIEGKPLQVFNHGEMYRDFTYVDDIVTGVMKVMQQPPAADHVNWDAQHPDPAVSSAPYRIYNIGNNKPVKLLDFVEAIEAELKMKANKTFLPLQPGDVVATHADVSDLMRDTGYQPATNIRDGVQQFIHWYKKYYQITL
ncbi:MAG: NAD-dependent epimerase [Bacteroidota bacterium]|nr:NAD-dependent epimerase [Bacteroidota bacterium]